MHLPRSSLLALALSALCAGSATATPDHVSYDLVLGQRNLAGIIVNNTDIDGMVFPIGVAVDQTRRHIYVASGPNSARILGWRDLAYFRTGRPPDLIIGQKDGATVDYLRSDSASVGNPGGLAVDKDGTLWVSDQSNGRIVGFRWPFDPAKSVTDNVTADVLIGQPEFDLGFPDKTCNGGASTTSSGPGLVCSPTALTVSPAGDLYVSDFSNGRVVRFKAPIAERGAQADLVFGQSSFVVTPAQSCNRNTGAAAANSLCRPNGVYYHQDGATSRLYILDGANSRVVVYDSPETNQTGANRVFGQANLTTGTPGTGTGQYTNPNGVTVSPTGVVWVSDGSNNRVHGYVPPFVGTGGFVPSYIIGQTALDRNYFNNTPPGMALRAPTAGSSGGMGRVEFDTKGVAYVADAGNHRILVFDQPEQVGPLAGTVVGQSDFNHGQPNRMRGESLYGPAAVAVDRSLTGGPIHVYVADYGNSRVLGWRDLSTLQNGQPADLALGQDNLLDGACNRYGAPGPRTLCLPRGVAVDKAGNVWVSDSFNHRLVRFPRPFDGGNGTADVVLGQSDFSAVLANRGGAAPAAGSLNGPSGLAIDEQGALWAADRNNNRVLSYAPPFTSGMAAGKVLIGPVAGDPMIAAGCVAATKGAYVCAPTGLALDADDNLWVAELGNNRVTLFRTTPPVAGQPGLNPVPLAILGQPNATDVAANNGTAAVATAQSLSSPTGVSVEVTTDGQGKRINKAIVVSDARNARVLIYPPVTSGFQAAATGVIGQDNRLDTRGQNLGKIDAVSRSRGLTFPVAVLAAPEGIFIAEGNVSYLDGTTNNLFRIDGNNRVLVIKDAGFPPPPPVPPAPDGGGSMVDGGATPDLSPQQPPGPAGCACDLGGRGGGGPVGGAMILLAVLGALLRRRR